MFCFLCVSRFYRLDQDGFVRLYFFFIVVISAEFSCRLILSFRLNQKEKIATVLSLKSSKDDNNNKKKGDTKWTHLTFSVPFSRDSIRFIQWISMKALQCTSPFPIKHSCNKEKWIRIARRLDVRIFIVWYSPMNGRERKKLNRLKMKEEM